ncbi:MAG: isoprenyl transferase [Rikenellaceae bacterium]|jgi:undecaprenyl diphosphate synthase|nr:isoprenyl transferase [Rikenellaceae bacterium]
MSQRTNVPQHIAVIMDGTGRWAKARGKERLFGHLQGVEAIRKVVRGAVEQGVKYLTLYAFSTENWTRPAEEVSGLMDLIGRYAVSETPELKRQGVRLEFIGALEGLSDEINEAIDYCRRETESNDRLHLVIALNYSSRSEIVTAACEIARRAAEGVLNPETIDEATVSEHLYTRSMPDPDLVIRTSGELRLSNFLLWQSAYAEFYFTDCFWPDFDQRELARAIEAYGRRERRFGGTEPAEGKTHSSTKR